jgi:endoglucanase
MCDAFTAGVPRRDAGRVDPVQLLAVVARRALCLTLAALCAFVAAGAGVASAQSPPLSISVVGNQFVNGSGQSVRLLGVDRETPEYACVTGTGYVAGPADASEAAAIAAWQVNAVRVPLNEDCWLGINDLPAYGTAEGYQQAIENYVADLNAAGIYAILDLQWSAPRTVPAVGVAPMPDHHSAPFWRSVAAAFVSDPAVVFDAFNEPQAGGFKDPDAYWPCWRDGGCTVSFSASGVTSTTYTAVGMQSLVDAIRSTGATQPILLSGLARGNDLTGWQAYMPVDPDRQLAASVHIYENDPCNTTACWNSTVAPLAAAVPVTVAEFGEQDCEQTFDDSVMQWGDTNDIGYLAWGWYVSSYQTCQMLALISDWTGTPRAPNGTALYDHLSALAAPGTGAALEQPVSVVGAAVEPLGQRLTARAQLLP